MRIICVSCPVGCAIEVEVAAGTPARVSGHGCPRGEVYAREEVLDPKRVLTTSVRVIGGDLPLASVRTTRPIPRRLIPVAMAALRPLTPVAPVHVGQVLIEDLLGTGVGLVATRTVAVRGTVDGEARAPIMGKARNNEKTQESVDRGTTPAHPGWAAGAGRGAHGGTCAEVRRIDDDHPQRSRCVGGEKRTPPRARRGDAPGAGGP